MENFDIVKYLKENHLGPHSILGGYVDLHALKEVEDNSENNENYEELEEALDYNNLTPEKLKGLADAGDFTAQRILKKKNDDADQRMKGQASNPGADGECEGNMYFHPQYGCIREREEDLEGWKMVKKLAANDKRVAAAFLKPLVTVYGEDNVKIVKQGEVYKIYTKGKEELNNEANYGNNQPVDKVPYGNGEGRLDGFGDEFDQVDPVEEANSDYYDDNEDPFAGMQDNDDRFDNLGGDQIKTAIKSLMDSSFPSGDIRQFVVDTIRGFESFKG